MRSFPATGWTLTHVHVDDLRHPSPARPARVLLRRERTPEYLLPVHGTAHQLFGSLLPEPDPSEWHALDPRIEWKPGHVPVIGAPDGRIAFVSPGTLAHRRMGEADRLLLLALESEEPVERRQGLLELADALLGGHVVPLAAEMHLARGDDGRQKRLRTRFLRAAPVGLPALEHRIADFSTISSRTHLADALRAAASEALREPIEANAWSVMRDETLARWWLHWRIAQGSTISRLAADLGVDSPHLRWLLRSSTGLAGLQGLPAPADMRRALEEIPSGAGVSADVALAEAHRPRLGLLARQLAALERLTSRGDRLARWSEVAASLGEERGRLHALNDLQPWERARSGSQEVHRTVLQTDARSPVETSRCLEKFGAVLAGTSLGAPDLVCASSFSSETGPVIALAPPATESGIGAVRFAIAHQLGHLMDPDAEGAGQPCALATAEPEDRGSAREAFANAFAMYLLAPRAAVRAQVQGAHVADASVLYDATADVATMFGLSAGAALRHVLNCADVHDFRRELGRVLARPDWASRREAIDAEVETAWAADREAVDVRIGAQRGWSIDAALRRPSSVRFDELIQGATDAGLLQSAEARLLLQA